MLEQPLKFFVVFFVVVEPVSLIPLFTGLTAGATRQYKRRMALRAVSVSAMILLLFALGGAAFLTLMGISLEAFRIFGGLLLFLLALEMVFARESGTRTSSSEAAESRRRADISVFPLAAARRRRRPRDSRGPAWPSVSRASRVRTAASRWRGATRRRARGGSPPGRRTGAGSDAACGGASWARDPETAPGSRARSAGRSAARTPRPRRDRSRARS